MDIGYVYKIFHIPICAQKYLDKYLTDSELEIIAHMGTNSFFPLQLAENMHLEVEQAEKLINSAYSRAVLNKDEKNPLAYGIGDFYTRLGVFCQFENEKWHDIPEAARQEISEWYLEEFIRLNRPLWEKGERNDKVVPLEDALEALDAQDGPFYVCLCDCRSIFERCKHSRETCISFYSGINSPADRGHARKISREEAKELVKTLDKEGLVHTLEGSYGMCNCCGDCCFEYQTAKKLDLIGTFPITHTIARWKDENCIHCGKCAKRCPMEAFVKKDRKVHFLPERCIGCGICSTACPGQAIEIVNRESKNK